MLVRLVAVLMGSVLLFGGSAWAQSDEAVSITAEAVPSEVGTAGTVTFQIAVRGAPLSKIETPDPPSTTNLALQEATPVTQRKLSFDSGQLQRRVIFKWRYRPMRVGVGRIQPVTVRVNQEAHETSEIRVRIVDQSQHTPRRSQTRPSPTGRTPDRADRPQSDNSGAPPDANEDISEEGLSPRDVFIRARASRDTAYQNQQVTAEYRLFFRPNVRLRKSRMASAWDAPGFWREELDVEAQPIPETTRMYGRSYKSIVLKRVALFPTRPGRLTVDPIRIKTEVRAALEMGARDEGRLRSHYEPMTLSSETLVIQARPLPPDAPEAFDGAVGQFALTTAVSSDSVGVGNGIELTARIRGQGNLATVPPPLVEVPSDFARYEPAVETTMERSDSTVRGEKTFTYTIVPRANGDYVLPPVQFAYFDPAADRYEQLRSSPTSLRVTGEASRRAVGQMGNGLPIGDIAGPMEADAQWIRTDRAPLYAQPWAYAALLGPLVLAAGAVAYRRRRPDAADDQAEGAAPLEHAQQRLQAARTHLRTDDGEAFYRALEQALLRFLEQRLDLPCSAPRMTTDEFDRMLREHEVSSSDRTALCDLLETCNQAQFGPSEPPPNAREEILTQAEALLPRLDEALAESEPISAA